MKKVRLFFRRLLPTNDNDDGNFAGGQDEDELGVAVSSKHRVPLTQSASRRASSSHNPHSRAAICIQDAEWSLRATRSRGGRQPGPSPCTITPAEARRRRSSTYCETTYLKKLDAIQAASLWFSEPRGRPAEQGAAATRHIRDRTRPPVEKCDFSQMVREQPAKGGTSAGRQLAVVSPVPCPAALTATRPSGVSTASVAASRHTLPHPRAVSEARRPQASLLAYLNHSMQTQTSFELDTVAGLTVPADDDGAESCRTASNHPSVATLRSRTESSMMVSGGGPSPMGSSRHSRKSSVPSSSPSKSSHDPGRPPISHREVHRAQLSTSWPAVSRCRPRRSRETLHGLASTGTSASASAMTSVPSKTHSGTNTLPILTEERCVSTRDDDDDAMRTLKVHSTACTGECHEDSRGVVVQEGVWEGLRGLVVSPAHSEAVGIPGVTDTRSDHNFLTVMSSGGACSAHLSVMTCVSWSHVPDDLSVTDSCGIPVPDLKLQVIPYPCPCHPLDALIKSRAAASGIAVEDKETGKAVEGEKKTERPGSGGQSPAAHRNSILTVASASVKKFLRSALPSVAKLTVTGDPIDVTSTTVLATSTALSSTTVPAIHTASTALSSTTVPAIHTASTALSSTTVPAIHTASTALSSTTVPAIHTASTALSSTTVPAIHTASTALSSTTVPAIHTASTALSSTTVPAIHTASTALSSTTVPAIHTASTALSSTTVPAIHVPSTPAGAILPLAKQSYSASEFTEPQDQDVEVVEADERVRTDNQKNITLDDPDQGGRVRDSTCSVDSLERECPPQKTPPPSTPSPAQRIQRPYSPAEFTDDHVSPHDRIDNIISQISAELCSSLRSSPSSQRPQPASTSEASQRSRVILKAVRRSSTTVGGLGTTASAETPRPPTSANDQAEHVEDEDGECHDSDCSFSDKQTVCEDEVADKGSKKRHRKAALLTRRPPTRKSHRDDRRGSSRRSSKTVSGVPRRAADLRLFARKTMDDKVESIWVSPYTKRAFPSSKSIIHVDGSRLQFLCDAAPSASSVVDVGNTSVDTKDGLIGDQLDNCLNQPRSTSAESGKEIQQHREQQQQQQHVERAADVVVPTAGKSPVGRVHPRVAYARTRAPFGLRSRKHPMQVLAEPNVDLFECKLCTDYLSPPVRQCVGGHGLCPACLRISSDGCPLCGKAVTPPGENFVLDQLVRTVLFPCKNSGAGCKESYWIEDRPRHEGKCPFRPRPCPCATHSQVMCPWSGLRSMIRGHMKRAHGHHGVVYPYRTFFPVEDFNRATWTGRTSRVEIVFVEHEIFELHKVFDDNNACLWGLLRHILARDTTAQFSYTIRFQPGNGPNIRPMVSFRNDAVAGSEDLDKAFVQGKRFNLHLDCFTKMPISMFTVQLKVQPRDKNKWP